MLKRLAIPASIAAAYGLYDWYAANGNFEISAYLKVTLPALFFVMWFVGLYEREKKKATDRESFESLATGLRSLTDLVQGLRRSPHASTARPRIRPYGPAYSESLIDEAFRILANGHTLAALLQAGVAFEQAVRSFARRFDIEAANQAPLHRILQRVDRLLPEEWRDELHVLRQIRNQLAHASEKELSRIIEQPEIILNTYAAAISALESREDLGVEFADA
jgi:hypothetical protein